MEQKKHLLLALCLLFVSNFLPVTIFIVDASIKPISKIPQLWEGRIYNAQQKMLAAPALKSTPLKADDEDSEEKNSGEEEEEDDIMADPPPPSPKKDDGAKGNSSSSNNGNKKNSKPSNEDDDIMKDLFNPNKTTSGTPKPTVVINNGGKNKKIGIGAVKPADDAAPSEDLKGMMDGAMAKATSIATNIGDAIKAALNSVAIALKNATEVTENSNSKSNATAVSSASCRPPSKGAISTTPLNMRSPNENCSDPEVPSGAIAASVYESGKGSGPISAITTTTKRQRRSSEVAKWPPQLPYAYGPHESHLLHNYAAAAQGTGTGSIGSVTNDVKDMNKHTDSSAPNSEGGIISQGQVGSEEESGSEEDTSGASNASSESVNNSTVETGGSGSGSGDASSSDTEGEGDKDAASFTPEVDAEEVTNPTTGGRGSGSSSPKMGGGGMDNNNGNTNMPGAGIGNPNLQSTTQKNVSVTVTNPAVDSIGSSVSSSSSSSSSASGFPPYPVMRKPGKCRPLTKGLSCIALAPDASQCSTDNGCPGTKKCCYYGCAPYTGVGICEFPVM